MPATKGRIPDARETIPSVFIQIEFSERQIIKSFERAAHENALAIKKYKSATSKERKALLKKIKENPSLRLFSYTR